MEERELGRKLKELRKRRGLSQREALRRVGISHTRLSDFEAGVTHGSDRPAIPGASLLRRLSEEYDYPLEALLELAGLPPLFAAEARGVYADDPELCEVVHIYQGLAPELKPLFLRVARSFGSR